MHALPSDAGQDTIDVLHDQGKHVVCYISIGSYEDWREDAGDFPDDAVGNTMDGWAGEKWLDITNEVLTLFKLDCNRNVVKCKRRSRTGIVASWRSSRLLAFRAYSKQQPQNLPTLVIPVVRA